MSAPRYGSRRAVALLAALMLLSLLALLTAGAFAAASFTRRQGDDAHTDAALSAAADYALGATLIGWQSNGFANLPLGQTQMVPLTPPVPPAIQSSVAVTRLPANIYWLVTDAVPVIGEAAHRRYNLVIRLPVIQSLPSVALVSAGTVSVGPGTRFDQDTTPVNGTACAIQGSPNVVLAPSARLIAANGGSIGGIVVSSQGSASDSATYSLAPEGWAALASRGAAQPSGSHVTLTATPITYGAGDLNIDGGSGAGLLLVEGQLTVDGPFVFSGLIVARGGIQILAQSDITGAILSASPAGAAPVSLQYTSLHFSSCAVAAAARAAARPRPVKGRAWVDLF